MLNNLTLTVFCSLSFIQVYLFVCACASVSSGDVLNHWNHKADLADGDGRLPKFYVRNLGIEVDETKIGESQLITDVARIELSICEIFDAYRRYMEFKPDLAFPWPDEHINVSYEIDRFEWEKSVEDILGQFKEDKVFFNAVNRRQIAKWNVNSFGVNDKHLEWTPVTEHGIANWGLYCIHAHFKKDSEYHSQFNAEQWVLTRIHIKPFKGSKARHLPYRISPEAVLWLLRCAIQNGEGFAFNEVRVNNGDYEPKG